MGTLIKVIVAVLLPPVGVLLHEGLTGHFLLNILLTLLGYIPGLVHALWRIFSDPERVVVYHVHHRD